MAFNFKRLEEISRALKPSKQTGKSFHTTFAFRGNKLLAIGFNNYNKLHPRHKFGEYKPKEKSDNCKYNACIHSETSCIIKLGLEDCRGISFINLRIDNNDDLAISKPCINCQRLLEQVGYKRVVYYDGKDFLEL